MGMKRSLELTLKHWDAGHRAAITGALRDAGIEIAESRGNFVQVRGTTPTEVKRITAGMGIGYRIGEGFRR